MPPVKPLVNDLNWNLLRSFCAIAEEKGITRAAKRLKQTRNGAQQRGFSAAVRPYQHRHFLLWDRKGDIIDDDFFLIARREVLQNQSRFFCVVSHVNANVIKKRNKYK